MPLTAADIIADAFFELNIYGAGETVSAEDALLGLGKLNRILDNWNAEHGASYAEVFTTYTLTPALTPHTIGPTGATFTAAIRPVSIEAANIVLTTQTPNVRNPVRLRDAQWWSGLPVPGVDSSIPTDLYYEPDWPNGKLFLYPVPDTAYGLELQTRTLLAAMAAATVFSLPPGYQDALTLTLAEALSPAFPGSAVSPQTVLNAREARARIFANNNPVPKLRTADAGMPGRRGGSYNYLTGQNT